MVWKNTKKLKRVGFTNELRRVVRQKYLGLNRNWWAKPSKYRFTENNVSEFARLGLLFKSKQQQIAARWPVDFFFAVRQWNTWLRLKKLKEFEQQIGAVRSFDKIAPFSRNWSDRAAILPKQQGNLTAGTARGGLWHQFRQKLSRHRRGVKHRRTTGLVIQKLKPHYSSEASGFAWFRSVWLQRLLNNLLLGGKKNIMVRKLKHILCGAKQATGVTPLITIFQALEVVRSPLRSSRSRRGFGSVILTKLLPWWKQYAVVLHNLRRTVRKSRARLPLEKRVLLEIFAILQSPARSELYKQKLIGNQLAVEARKHGHFRWRSIRRRRKTKRLKWRKTPLVSKRFALYWWLRMGSFPKNGASQISAGSSRTQLWQLFERWGGRRNWKWIRRSKGRNMLSNRLV